MAKQSGLSVMLHTLQALVECESPTSDLESAYTVTALARNLVQAGCPVSHVLKCTGVARSGAGAPINLKSCCWVTSIRCGQSELWNQFLSQSTVIT